MSDCCYGVSPVNYPDPDPDYMVSANIQCIILYISQQTNAKPTNKIHINRYLLTLNSSDDVIYLIVEKNPCPNSRN